MKRLAVLAAFLLFPASASAQAVVGDGQSFRGVLQGQAQVGIVRADSTAKLLTVDSDGNLKVAQSSLDRNYYKTFQLINNQLTASGAAMADSSSPQATYDLRRMGLMIYPTAFDSLSTIVRLAVQVRAHMTNQADSASSFPWARYSVGRSTTAGNYADSVGHWNSGYTGPLTPVQTTTATAAAPYLYPGEIMVTFNFARDDSTANGNGKPWSFPKGIYLPLVGALGEWFWAPYTSVRVRVINGVRNRFRVRVDMVGSPL